MDLQLHTIEQLADELLRRSEFGSICLMMDEKDDEPYYYSNFKGSKEQVEDSLCEVEQCFEELGF
jgi:hypothetical protein